MAAAAGAPVAVVQAALQFHGPGDVMGGMGWMMWGAWIFGILFWVAVFVLLLVVIWKLVGAGSREGKTSGGVGGGEAVSAGGGRGETSLAILERRYAAGEIDRDEFLQKREDLRSG